MKNKDFIKVVVIIIAVLLSAAAFIICGFYIGNGASKITTQKETAFSEASQGLLMDEIHAAQYLGVDIEDFRSILKSDRTARANQYSYPSYKFIPYIEIGGYRYFNGVELQKWVEFNMHNK